MVDSLAARVTKPAVLSFPGFMRLLGVLLFLPISLLLVAANSPGPSASPSPTTEASPSPSTSPPPSPSPSASPSPSPIPVNAFLSLDVTAGGPTTQITVNGGAFLPNEQMTLYWDQATKIAGGANADGSGNFVTHVKPFSGDGPGAHKLCASVQPNPCATFTLDATPTSPSPSPSPSESPPPSAPAASEPATPPAADGTDYSPVEWGPGGGGWGYAEPTPPDESPETPQPGD